jgi:peptidoglycan-associated lipoprotein
MVRSRCILLIAPLLTLLLIAGGCSKKLSSPEIELPDDAFGAKKVSAAPAPAPEIGRAAAKPWSPSGAPSGAAGGNGFNEGLAPAPDFATDTAGGIPQTSALDGVESATEIADLDMVHFDYDQSDIKPEWQTILDHHAQWLAENQHVHVQVEGHCDERGTEEYNLALGQRRADTVRTYLVEQGVSPDRIATISWGKLRPLAFDTSSEAHALNRRAMFLVYMPGMETASAGGY